MWNKTQLQVKFQPDNLGKKLTCVVTIHHVPNKEIVKIFIYLATSFKKCHNQGLNLRPLHYDCKSSDLINAQLTLQYAHFTIQSLTQYLNL